jgi:Mg2+ and Co2+ transporter CorA
MVESNKDRQEKAALTFTTVTVLFLPMTLLASIFGMNTSDIRNMNDGQWIFWVIAGPFCVVGLLLWLLYLGTLSTWWQRLKDMARGNKSEL